MAEFKKIMTLEEVPVYDKMSRYAYCHLQFMENEKLEVRDSKYELKKAAERERFGTMMASTYHMQVKPLTL